MLRDAGGRCRDRRRASAVVAPARLPLALPIIVLWCLSPGARLRDGAAASAATATVLEPRPSGRRFARSRGKTWRFFDDLAGPADHWLIPDNIQENRRELVAHRTSPTNIGLQLLSTLAAYDFGYLTAARS